MENTAQETSLCKSFFKSSDNSITKAQYTKKWIELINIIERNKEFAVARQ